MEHTWFPRARWGKWLWFLVIANAACVLFFRCFITLDGSLHVLHAAVLKDAIGDRAFTAHGLRYTLDGIDIGVLDPIAMLLLAVLPPTAVEVALGAVALLAFAWGAVTYVRAYGNAQPVLAVWALPLAFSFPLLLGLFPFVFAMGLCLWLAARWVRVDAISWRVLLWSLAALALCMAAHRGAVLLLVLLTGVNEVLLFCGDREAFRKRWAIVPERIALIAFAAFAISGAAVAVHFLFFRRVYEPVGDRAPLTDLLHLRSMLLLDHHAEAPLLIAVAALMLLSLVLAVRALLLHPAPLVKYAPLITAVLLLLASVLVRTPWAYLHYFAERAQLFGLLLLMLWCALHVRSSRWSLALAACILGLHTMRTVYLERRMAHYADERRLTREVLAYLQPNSIVAPVYCEEDWLLLHQFAGIAADHKGIVLTKRDKVWVERYGPTAEALRHAIKGKPERWRWLQRCAADPQCPPIDHIVVLGYSGDSCMQLMPLLPEVLSKSYDRVFGNGYAGVWRRK